jgi:hypothetical protein
MWSSTLTLPCLGTIPSIHVFKIDHLVNHPYKPYEWPYHFVYFVCIHILTFNENSLIIMLC